MNSLSRYPSFCAGGGLILHLPAAFAFGSAVSDALSSKGSDRSG